MDMDTAGERSIAGMVFLVTGASRGIGRAIATKLASYGAIPVLTSRSKQALEALAIHIRNEYGHDCLYIPADLTDEGAIEAMVSRIDRTYGMLDGLINNAGVTFRGTIEQTPTAVWDMCMAVNARAPFIICRLCLPLLRRGQGRRIINISSVVGVKGYAMQTAYTASKHALRGLSIALAEELAADSIVVHVICPGGVDTDLVRQVRPDIPQDQLIRPEEIARLVIFLLTSGGCGVIDEVHIRRQSSRPWF